MDQRRSSATRRRQLGLLITAIILVFGWNWIGWDTVLLAALLAAGALIWSSREWQAWLVAALIVAAGLSWSSKDNSRCSAWWRGRVVFAKVTGALPYQRWRDIAREVVAPSGEIAAPEPEATTWAEPIGRKWLGEEELRLYQTRLGSFWIAASPAGIAFLVWEVTSQHAYDFEQIAVRPGDIVIDAGAHVGVYSAYALQQGARRVIAIEPDPTNLFCLESNLAREIGAGRVTVVRAGIWDRHDSVPLSRRVGSSGLSTFVGKIAGGTTLQGVALIPLDEIVEQLRLDRVDFIKMDIEGAERHAISGARRTIVRYRPRMAICSYHLEDDPRMIPLLVRAAAPSYDVFAKDTAFISGRVSPKVLFFADSGQ